MNYTFRHSSIYVRDIERSIAFYREALGLEIQWEKVTPDNNCRLVFMGNENAPAQVELSWIAHHEEPYDLGENRSHLGFAVDDYWNAHKHHKQMGCVKHEMRPYMDVYFIEDPDGYEIEIFPAD